MDPLFTQQLASAESSGAGLAWQYLGTRHGVYRFFPGNVWGQNGGFCSEYDPRKRPWYVAAASGAKRLILVLDVSGSMSAGVGSNTRINIAKLAAKEVLATLTNADYFGIVIFSSDARKLNSQLVRGTSANIELANDWLDRNVVANGQTYPDAAFTAAFDILDRSAQVESGTSACRSVILFMSDGDPTGNSGDDALGVLRTRTNTPNGKDAFVFTYSLGAEASKTFPKQIACENNGVWARITNTRDLISAMAGYYEFIAAGLERSSAVWTESYVDALGLGLVTTAAFPAYDRTTNPPTLVGVAGVDVKMSDFLSTGASASDTLDVLVARSSICGSFNATYCTLEALRGEEKCDSSRFQAQCSADTAANTCALSATGSAFCAVQGSNYNSEAQYTSVACCAPASSSSAEGAGSAIVVGGVVGGIALLAVVGAAVYFKSRKSAKAPASSASAAPPQQAAPVPPPSQAPQADVHTTAHSASTFSYSNPNARPTAYSGQPPAGHTVSSMGYYPAQGQYAQGPPGYGMPPTSTAPGGPPAYTNTGGYA